MSKNRKRRIQKEQQTKNTRRVEDGFSNQLARMGANTLNLLESTEYVSKNITRNSQMLNTLYREHWLVNKLINSVPEDMLKNWYKLDSQLQPDSLQKFRRLERTTNLHAKILEGLRWGRLYGGGAGIIMIEGHEDILDEPLELDLVMPDSFKGLIILDRYSGITPMSELVTDINSPDFGLPKYYTVHATESVELGQQIHHSRIVRFTGRELPYIDKISEMYWGVSEIEHIFEELKKRDNTSWNIAMLVFSANMKVYKMDGMGELGLMDEMAQKDLHNALSAMSWMMNNQGMQIIGKEDDFVTHQFSFSGLAQIYEMFIMDLAGACEMPVTKLFGRSPAGMNATGESDMQNYYDHIEEQQESALRPVIDKLLPIMCMSIFGAIPDDLDYSFNPCRRPTEEERKNLASQVANSVVAVFNAGIINQKIALKELRQSSEMTGMWTNITDSDIDEADDEFGSFGEDMPKDMLKETEGEENEALDSFCTDADSKCRAKDPSKCKVHGNEESESKAKENSIEKPLKLKKVNGKINITGKTTARSGSETYLLEKGSQITGIKVFAGKGTNTPIRKRKKLSNDYGGAEDSWEKTRGNAKIDVNGTVCEAEVHWFENQDVGIVELKIKRWRG